MSPAKGFIEKVKFFQRGRRADHDGFMRLLRKAPCKFVLFGFCHQHHFVNHIPVDAVGKLIHFVTMQPSDNATSFGQMAGGQQQLAGPFKKDHLIVLQKRASNRLRK